MGVALKDLIVRKEISFDELKDKMLVVDAYNNLYQYLSSIRQRDGSLLTDSKGNITSHLIGLFARTTSLMQKGLKLIFVFDGEPPEMKKEERERRKEIKIEAEKKYLEAEKKGNQQEMKKYAARTSRLTSKMVDEAKRLVEALGLPVIQAISEGEAQAAHMVNKGDAFAIISQDYDSLLYGAERVLQNVTISAKRKIKGSVAYQTLKPSMIGFSENLNYLGIDKDQLIVLSILVGTDYNIGGVKGIGPKNALKLVKQYGSDFDDLFEDVKWADHFNFPWTDVYYTFKKMPMKDDYELKWKEPNEKELRRLLVEEHDFSEDRFEKTIKKLIKNKEEKKQKGLGDFF
ncbi:flap endonuclease-1 [Candidatus Woesearchaeota archaeon]|nr:flap endonuclease-1 [Candidatus Woesearchaeota archaeon]